MRSADLFDSLGLSRVVNAAGTLTAFGGCRARPSVAAAMAAASGRFVDLDALLKASGVHLAKCIGAEAALVTAGASPGIMQSVAACIAGSDPWMRDRLPSNPPEKRNVVIMRCHRNPYDNAVSTAGGRFVEIGNSIHTHPWELAKAIDENTAAVFFALQAEMLVASLSLDDTIAIAHAAGVPVIVDAAAELPPKANLRDIARRGADLVIFSGGKEIGGPQSSGLVVGSPALVESAWFNGAPHYGVGRPAKAGKENVAGFVAAMEDYLAEDEGARMHVLQEIRDAWIVGLKRNSGMEAGIFVPTQPGIHPVCIPKAYFRPSGTGPSAPEIQARLRALDPSVLVDVWKDSVILNPQTLREDEADEVLRSILRVIGA